MCFIFHDWIYYDKEIVFKEKNNPRLLSCYQNREVFTRRYCKKCKLQQYATTFYYSYDEICTKWYDCIPKNMKVDALGNIGYDVKKLSEIPEEDRK